MTFCSPTFCEMKENEIFSILVTQRYSFTFCEMIIK